MSIAEVERALDELQARPWFPGWRLRLMWLEHQWWKAMRAHPETLCEAKECPICADI